MPGISYSSQHGAPFMFRGDLLSFDKRTNSDVGPIQGTTLQLCRCHTAGNMAHTSCLDETFIFSAQHSFYQSRRRRVCVRRCAVAQARPKARCHQAGFARFNMPRCMKVTFWSLPGQFPDGVLRGHFSLWNPGAWVLRRVHLKLLACTASLRPSHLRQTVFRSWN